MGLLFKVTGLLGICISFLIIVFSTFFSAGGENFEAQVIAYSGTLLGSGGVIQDQISEFEAMYALEKGYMQDSDQFIIQKPGKYLSSLRNIENNYSLSSTGYTLSQQGIGDVYIDTITTPGKTFVYTMNSPVTITLHNNEKSEDYVDIYLAPHMYLEFDANRGRYLKNADRLRISTIFKLGYIGNIGEYSSDQEYITKYFQSQDNFFSVVSKHIQEQDEMKSRALNDFQQANISQIPRLAFIQRYLHLFVNKEKKKVFYKNLVLSGYKELLDSEKMNESIIRDIEKDLEILKDIDGESYNDMLELQDRITTLLYSSSDVKYIIAKIAFSSLGNSGIEPGELYFPLYGFALFANYDSSKIFSNDLSKKLIQSFHPLENPVLEYDYFLYYLEQQLLFLLEKPQEVLSNDYSVIFHTLESYADITRDLEYSDSTQNVTRLFVISNILKNIDLFMRSEYFMQDRNEDGILVLSSQNKIIRGDLDSLENSIEILYKIFEDDEKVLSTTAQRDISIRDDIMLFDERLEEYFAALENYSSYQDKYDILKKNSLNLDTFSFGDDEGLSLDKLQKYLSTFVGLSMNSLEAEISADHYRINNIIISGRVFSFDLYPNALNKMGNITIDGNEITSQYKLSTIKLEWEEKFKTAEPSEKEKFNFSNFFLLTFFSNTSQNIEEYVISDSGEQEDKAEVVFKKDILLGKGGEFESVSNILNISYEDIEVEKSGDHYDIFLSDIGYIVQNTVDPNKSSVSGNLELEYVLNNVDHYFKNIQLQIEKDINSQKVDYLFGGNFVLISGKIHIADISEQLEKIANDVLVYDSIYREIENIITGSAITLQYTTFNQKLSLKFDYQGKKYNILLTGGRVESIYRGTEKILSGNINFNEISNYIK